MTRTLLRVETDRWRLEVSGPIRAAAAEVPPFLKLTANTSVTVSGDAHLSIYNRDTGKLETGLSGTPVVPLLFENTSYDFYLRVAPNTDMPTLRMPPAADCRHLTDDMAHYSISFGNDVGNVEIGIADPTNPVTVCFEVFARKIDFRSDYIAMRDEVAAIARNLVITVQARTFGFASPFASDRPSLAEWLALIQRYFDELMGAGQAIAQNPHSKLLVDTRLVSVHKARRVDGRALERILRRQVTRSEIQLPHSGALLPNRVPEVHQRLTYDTDENRYIKTLLLETRRNLLRVIQSKATGDEDADLTAEQKFFQEASRVAGKMLRRLDAFARSSFLETVDAAPASRPTSLVLHLHPHYAAFVRIATLLNGGLSVEGGALQVGVKNIATLYEYWCFLRLLEMLANGYDLEQQSLVKIDPTRATLVLAKGKRSTVQFRGRTDGKRLLLIYNRRFSPLPTLSQEPDNIIQLASEQDIYIFDAKYRLAFDPKYREWYGGVGPQPEDINTMHRYRDAIVTPLTGIPGQYERGIVRAAIVLFPYPDEAAYRNHRFFQSIASVQIGGLPFLPGTSALVGENIRDILVQYGFALPITKTA